MNNKSFKIVSVVLSILTVLMSAVSLKLRFDEIKLNEAEQESEMEQALTESVPEENIFGGIIF